PDNDTYKFQIHYEFSLMLPDSSQNIIQNFQNGLNRFVTLKSIYNNLNKSSGLLSSFSGRIFLANENVTPLIFDTVEINNPNIYITTQNGSITIVGVCQPDLRKVALMNPTTLTLTPNPANDNLEIQIETGIDGMSDLEFYNVQGMLVQSIKLDLKANKKNIGMMNLSDFSSGIYEVILKTDWITIVQKLYVIK
ncbi:MAG: T9SS type A sorting domain-containing protein, partial [FCB group bacterium]